MTRKISPHPYRTPLSFEALGNREAPSSLFGGGFGEPNLSPVAAESRIAVAAENEAPSIVDFRAIVGRDGQVTFVGRVVDDQAVAGTVVHIVGRGIDVTAVVLRDGTFSVTTTVDASGDITVSATVTDANGATSNPVYTTFSPSN
jgi:hypothetical protein